MTGSSSKPSFIQPGFGNDWLENMHEIAIPQAVSVMPKTWGWLVVGMVILMVVAVIAWRRYMVWKSLAYQRQAMQQLQQMARDCQQNDVSLQQLRALPELLKRVAIREYSRDKLAGLSGERWLVWLDSTLPGCQFSQGPGALLPQLAYATDSQLCAIGNAQLQLLLQLLIRWLQRPRTGPDSA